MPTVIKVVRVIVYALIGLVFFSVAGLLIGHAADETASITFFVTFGMVVVSGVTLCVLLAIWMGRSGERGLVSFSLRPKMEYGIFGSVFAAIGLMKLDRHLDPANAHPLLLLLVLATGVIVGGPALLFFARKMDLPSITTTRW